MWMLRSESALHDFHGLSEKRFGLGIVSPGIEVGGKV